ncbi:Serine/threonine kinase [Acidisarcina polymorpha]|uniref:Serine/threonine kinase n=1 Tax=Acidisarcina polymorpha TaxID=2211140 RepID=A0A2Z5G3X3_9BACT|nr:protein kinase [Acidisarcina polymorpha]AXC13206.1 Serine/threonine kinase [Acidisarcina polymorpha]
MNFWNDYEGKTIAGSYPLERLLYPEGRSGLFATSNGTGTPSVLRLTETLNDQEEILEQWQTVRDLKHPNLIAIRSFGATEVDDIPLIYAVMESPDINLGEVLRDRAMNTEETMQIATSLISALQALHRRGIVHGHLEPANVFAVGETVKLRSDCVRKPFDNAETLQLQSQDVKDLAMVLLQALTRERRVERLASIGSIPSSLNDAIRKGLSGDWGLDEVAAALGTSPIRTPRAVVAPPVDLPKVLPETAKEAPPVAKKPVETKPAETKPYVAKPYAEARPRVETKPRVEKDQNTLPFGGSTQKWPKELGAYAAIAVVLIMATIAWYFFHPLTPEARAIAYSKPQPSTAPAATGKPLITAPAAGVSAPPPAPVSVSAASPSADPPSSPITDTASRDAWRVVAYTYNRESQARKKVERIDRRHASLKPDVFSPTGHAPFLVTLGGPMTREQAEALKQHARSAGFPRDTYVQNYVAK